MTKKKLVTFITLAFAVILIITSVMLFYAYMPSVDFRLTYDRVNNGIDYHLSRYGEENKTAEKVEEAVSDETEPSSILKDAPVMKEDKGSHYKKK